ncbi:precorrin-6Y C5,15-methyltransferase [Mycolicibacterium madagascariense]|uniref:Precorrin-6Y C5,15-methyltransferase n=1 Tax=Mycolicibacterium madagascariense TaxID=212765 RepID=A0A7I7XDW9_9MYCO|nr:precorrin-6y C5,15-methyltransferase (decarboxylating) subunit CbiE [Mycolicibacterium madagascariense]MCV7011289.1 precorrin-6y C5,15-methyltransferase (decarboxylating) subunit CbiE [Mycolicibacterium madagascariense]BBZ26668.1 precorrin-6Y C5,15-methyltransferase [Mycolicibacterium madagascariense]
MTLPEGKRSAGEPHHPRLTVVGIGADGWAGLTDAARVIVQRADVVLGAPRQLGLLPDATGQLRRAWPSPLRPQLEALLDELAGRDVVALASGDPLVSGIGTTLIDVLGAERVTVVPHVSSVALARARLGWSAESTAVVSVVGRDVHAVLREVAPERRVLVLSSDEHTPGALAALLTEHGYGATRLTVLGDLGSDAETRVEATAAAFDAAVPRLNIVAAELKGPLTVGWAPGLSDDAFEHDGQLTKRDLRASALARLLPAPGQLLWDVGAGAGSVGIEWMRAHPTCRTIAIEADGVRAERITRNAAALGVPALRVVHGSAPQALAGQPAPDAIFVGGGASHPGVLEGCLAALPRHGRLVVHGVTLETEVLLADAYRDHGGELVRIHVEHAAPIGSFTGWTPARAVTQWAYQRGE